MNKMNRWFKSAVALVALAFAFAAQAANWVDSAADSFASQDNEKKTITIATAEQLALLAKQFSTDTIPEVAGNNAPYTGWTFTLTADIDLSGKQWTPIGGDKSFNYQNFCGHFDGGNHKITGMTVSGAKYLGLFGSVGYNVNGGSTFVVENLTIENASVTGTSTACAIVAGGTGGGTIKNVTVKNSSVSGLKYVGAIIGECYSDVSGCKVLGTKDAPMSISASEKEAAGIVGFACDTTREFKDCLVQYVNITAPTEVAGIVARILRTNTTVKDNCVANVTLTATDNTTEVVIGDVGTEENKYVGHFVGHDYDSKTPIVMSGNTTTPPAGPVAKIGEKTYTDLATAISEAKAGETVEIIKAGDYAMLDVQKAITVKAAKENNQYIAVNVPFTAGYNIGVACYSGVTFEGITFSMSSNQDFCGINNGSDLRVTFVNCTFNKRFTTYGSMICTGCTFNQDGADYCITAYAPYANEHELSFTDCTFNNTNKGKFLNLYNQNEFTYEVTVDGCTFNNGGTKSKAAILMKEIVPPSTQGRFVLNILGTNTLVGQFPVGIYESEVTAAGGDGLWANEGATPPTGLCSVFENGAQVYPELEPDQVYVIPETIKQVETDDKTITDVKPTEEKITEKGIDQATAKVIVEKIDDLEETAEEVAPVTGVAELSEDIEVEVQKAIKAGEIVVEQGETNQNTLVVAVQLTTIKVVEAPAAEATTQVVTKATFEVKPVVSVQVSQIEPTPGSEVKTNNYEIAVPAGTPITFRLPVDAATTAVKAEVFHETESLGYYDVQVENGDKFVEITASDFSQYGYELLTSVTADTVAMVGGQGYPTLAAAITAAEAGQTITIVKDFTENGVAAFSKSLTIDFDGHTWTCNVGNGNTRALTVQGSADLTLKDGAVTTGSSVYGSVRFESTGKLTVSGMTLTNSMAGGLNLKLCSGTAEVVDTTINSTNGGGIESGNASTVVNNCTIVQSGMETGGYSAANCTAMTACGGSSLTVNGGSYKGDYAAINLNNSGATVVINGGTFTAGTTGNVMDNQAASGKSGITNINGGDFTGVLYVQGQGGTLEYNLAGGTYSVKPEGSCVNVAAGYELAQVGDKWVVATANVAKIVETGTLYPTLAEAIGSATAGQTVQLLKDATVDAIISIGKNLSLDLNGFTLSNAVTGGRPLWLNAANITVSVYGGAIVDTTAGQSYGIFDIRNDLTGVTLNVSDLAVGTFDSDGSALALYRTDFGALFKNRGTWNTVTLDNVMMATDHWVVDSPDLCVRAQDSVFVVDHSAVCACAGCENAVGAFNQDSYGEHDDSWFKNVKIVGKGGTLSRVHGIVSQGQDLEITNCDIEIDAVGKSCALATAYEAVVTVQSGYYSAPYACAVLSSGGQFDINGGTFIGSTKALSANTEQEYQPTESVINVYGADTYVSGDLEVSSDNTYITLAGGTYDREPNLFTSGNQAIALADGYEVVKSSTIPAYWTVQAAPAVATLYLGETAVKSFATIKAAVQAWNEAGVGAYTIVVKDNATAYDEADIVFWQNVDGRTLTLRAETAKGVTIKPTTSVSSRVFLFQGCCDYARTADITIDGINVDVTGCSGYYPYYFAAGKAGNADPNVPEGVLNTELGGQYAHNITVKNCDLTATFGNSNIAFECEGNSSPSGLLVKDCVCTGFDYVESAYLTYWSTRDASKLPYELAFVGGSYTCKAFVNNQGLANMLFDGCAVNATKDYVIRTKSSTGNNHILVTNATITATTDATTGGIVVCRDSDTVTILDSTFVRNGGVEWDVQNPKGKTVTITSGSYVKDAEGHIKETLTADKVLASDTPGFNFGAVVAVAKIGDTPYPTLKAAADAAVSGDTITLVADCTVASDEVVDIKDGVTFTAGTYTLTNGGTIKVAGTVKFSAGTYTGNLLVGDASKATVLTTDGLVATHGNLLLADGSTVTMSGNGFNFRTDNTDNKYLTVQNAAEQKNSWDGSGNLGHVGNTLTVTNVTDDVNGFKAYAFYVNANSTNNIVDSALVSAEYVNVYGGQFNVKNSNLKVHTTINVTGEMIVNGGSARVCFVNVYDGYGEGYNGGRITAIDTTFDGTDRPMTVGGKKSGTSYYEKGDDAGAVVTLIRTTLKSSCLTNKGMIRMDVASKIILTPSSEESSKGDYQCDGGVIEVDMTGATEDSYTLVTATAASTYGTAGTNYKFAEGKANGYELSVEGNDLVAKKASNKWTDHAAASYATPVDTVNKIVTIASAEELALFAKGVNERTETYNGYTVNITADIDLSAYEWVSIKALDENAPQWYWDALQNVTINGNHHVISGLTIDQEGESEQGLIGVCAGKVTIKDVVFAEADVVCGTRSGIVVGSCYNVITLDGVTVTNSTLEGDWYDAALIGFTGGNGRESFVRNCVCATVTVTGKYDGEYNGTMVGLVNDGDTVRLENNLIKSDCYCNELRGSFVGVSYNESFSAVPAAAQIGEWMHPSLEVAVKAVEQGGTITLLANNSESFTAAPKSGVTAFTISAGSYTLTGTITTAEGYELKDNGDGTWSYQVKSVDKWIDFADAAGVSVEGNVYTVSSEEGLAWITKQVHDKVTDFAGKTVKLAADLDLAGKLWTSIAETKTYPFKGVFDGDGHAISYKLTAAYVDDGADVGDTLFGYVYGTDADNRAGIKNLTVSVAQDMDNFQYVKKSMFAGVVIATQYAEVSDVVTTAANLTVVKNSERVYTGGISFYDYGGSIYTRCTNNISIAASNYVLNGNWNNFFTFGGIAGRTEISTPMFTVFQSCANHGSCVQANPYDIDMTGKAAGWYAQRTVYGGIVGQVNYADRTQQILILDCTSDGACRGSGNCYWNGSAWQNADSGNQGSRGYFVGERWVAAGADGYQKYGVEGTTDWVADFKNTICWGQRYHLEDEPIDVATLTEDALAEAYPPASATYADGGSHYFVYNDGTTTTTLNDNTAHVEHFRTISECAQLVGTFAVYSSGNAPVVIFGTAAAPASYVAQVTIGGVTTKYETLAAAVDAAKAANVTNVTLLADCTVDSEVVIGTNVTATVITRIEGTNTVNGGYYTITVKDGGKLVWDYYWYDVGMALNANVIDQTAAGNGLWLRGYGMHDVQVPGSVVAGGSPKFYGVDFRGEFSAPSIQSVAYNTTYFYGDVTAELLGAAAYYYGAVDAGTISGGYYYGAVTAETISGGSCYDAVTAEAISGGRFYKLADRAYLTSKLVAGKVMLDYGTYISPADPSSIGATTLREDSTTVYFSSASYALSYYETNDVVTMVKKYNYNLTLPDTVTLIISNSTGYAKTVNPCDAQHTVQATAVGDCTHYVNVAIGPATAAAYLVHGDVTNYYSGAQQAMTAAQAGDKVYLNADCSTAVSVKQGVTFYLNGWTMTGSVKASNADELAVYDEASGSYTARLRTADDPDAVASVDYTSDGKLHYFNSLYAAVSKIGNGTTATLLKDISMGDSDGYYSLAAGKTIDGGGHTVTYTGTKTPYVVYDLYGTIRNITFANMHNAIAYYANGGAVFDHVKIAGSVNNVVNNFGAFAIYPCNNSTTSPMTLTLRDCEMAMDIKATGGGYQNMNAAFLGNLNPVGSAGAVLNFERCIVTGNIICGMAAIFYANPCYKPITINATDCYNEAIQHSMYVDGGYVWNPVSAYGSDGSANATTLNLTTNGVTKTYYGLNDFKKDEVFNALKRNNGQFLHGPLDASLALDLNDQDGFALTTAADEDAARYFLSLGLYASLKAGGSGFYAVEEEIFTTSNGVKVLPNLMNWRFVDADWVQAHPTAVAGTHLGYTTYTLDDETFYYMPPIGTRWLHGEPATPTVCSVSTFDADGNLLSSVPLSEVVYNLKVGYSNATESATYLVDTLEGAFDLVSDDGVITLFADNTETFTATAQKEFDLVAGDYAFGEITPAAGYALTEVETGVWHYGSAAVPVAQVISADGSTTNEFTTVQAAVEAAESGDTVKLIANSAESAETVVAQGKTVTINLNGCVFDGTIRFNGTLTVVDTVGTGYIDCVNDWGLVGNGSLTLDASLGHNAGDRIASGVYTESGSITLLDNAKIYASMEGVRCDGGSLTIEANPYVLAYAEAVPALSLNGGCVARIAGGTYKGSFALAGDDGTQDIQVTGGKFSGYSENSVVSFGSGATVAISGGIFEDNSAKDYLASGYEVVDNPDPATAEDYPYAVVQAARTIEVTPLTVQEALDTAKKGDTIVLTEGEYGVLYLRNNGSDANRIFEDVTIKVKAGDAVTVDQIAYQPVSGKSLDVENLTIDGITFDAPAKSAVLFDENGGYLRVNGLTVQYCTKVGDNSEGSLYDNAAFLGCYYDGATAIGATFNGDTSLTRGYHNISVLSNAITNVLQPIKFPNDGPLYGLTVSGNTFTGCTDNHMMLSTKTTGAILIENNAIVDMTGRFARISGAQGDAAFTITNNTVTTPRMYDTGGDGDIVKITGTAGFTVTQAANQWIDGEYQSGGTKWIAMGDKSLIPVAQVVSTGVKYTTVQAAVEAVTEDGDTVKLLCDVELDAILNGGDNSITIDGDGYTITQKTGVVPGSTPPYHWFCFGAQQSPSGVGKTFTFKNATLDGFTSGTYMFRVESCTMTLDNVTFNECAGTYVVIFTYADAVVQNCRFTDNTAADRIVDFNSNADGDGGTYALTVTNSLFRGNTANGSAIVGIAEDETVTVADCTFDSNVLNSSNNGAPLYLGDQCGTCTGSFFTNNVVNYTTTTGYDNRVRASGGVFTWSAGTPKGVITNNVFIGNRVVKQNASYLSCYAKSAYSDGYYAADDLCANYWEDGHQPVIGQKSLTSTNNDVYAEYNTHVVYASSYGTGYALKPNSYGVMVDGIVDLAVAEIVETGVRFAKLQEAIYEANGKTVKLLADVSGETCRYGTGTPRKGIDIYAINTFTLDLNGHTWNTTGTFAFFFGSGNNVVTVVDGADLKTGKIMFCDSQAFIYGQGLAITAGTYNKDVSAGVGEGYVVIDNGDGTWTVKEADPFSGEGSGTAEDPYQIATVAQLREVDVRPSKHYVLTADLELEEDDLRTAYMWGQYETDVAIDVFTGTLGGTYQGVRHSITLPEVPGLGGLVCELGGTLKDIDIVLNGGSIAVVTGDNAVMDGVEAGGTVEASGNCAAYVTYGAEGMLFNCCTSKVEIAGIGGDGDYNAIFIGYAMTSEPFVFSNCVNAGSIVCGRSSMFIGNMHSYTIKLVVEGCANTGTIRSTHVDDYYKMNYYYSTTGNNYDDFIVNGQSYGATAERTAAQQQVPSCYEDDRIVNTGVVTQGPLDTGMAFYRNDDGTFRVIPATGDTIGGKAVAKYVAASGLWVGVKDSSNSSRQYATEDIVASGFTRYDTTMEDLYYVDSYFVDGGTTTKVGNNTIFTKDDVDYYVIGDAYEVGGVPAAPEIYYLAAFDANGKLLASVPLMGATPPEPVAQVISADGSTTNEFTTVQAAVGAVTEDGQTIRLVADVELAAALDLGSHSIALDANGHVFTQKPGTSSNNAWFLLGEQGTGAGKSFVLKNAVIDGFTDGLYLLWAQSCAVVIDNCTFTNNAAFLSGSDFGGIIECQSADMTITNSVFTANSSRLQLVDFNSSGEGGALSVSDSLFDGNTCGANGVIYYADGDGVEIVNNTFANNVESGDEATVILAAAGVVSGNFFTNNTVTLSSGDSRCAILATGSFSSGSGEFTGNAFVGNTLVPNESTANATVFVKGNSDLSANYWGAGEAPEEGQGADYAAKSGVTVSVATYATDYAVNANGRGVTVTLAPPAYVAQVLEISGSTTNLVGEYTSLAAAVAASTTLDGHTILMIGNDTLTERIELNKSITLDLNGKTIDGDGKYGFWISSSKSVVINDASGDDSGKITHCYKGYNKGEAGAIKVSSGTLTLNGGTFTENTTTFQGGAIFVNGGCTFTMNGGRIVNNTAPDKGGAVQSSGSFVMNGGVISGNSGTYGGGVILGGGDFTMTGGEIINNTATTKHGGGVYTEDATNVTITGGFITNNTAYYHGGGVMVNKPESRLTIENCVIADNACITADGGGIWSSAPLSITNSTISGNSAFDWGGGIRASSTVSIGDGVVISGNTTGGTGGGIFFDGSDVKTIAGNVIISGNVVTNGNGGAIGMRGGAVTLGEGVVIDADNAATGKGNGIYAYYSSKFTQSTVINGGTYDADIYFAYLSASSAINAGKFSAGITYADGLAAVPVIQGGVYTDAAKNASDVALITAGKGFVVNFDEETAVDYPWTIGVPAASIVNGNTTYTYDSLKLAIGEVKDGETIVLLADNAETIAVDKACKFSIDNSGAHALGGTVTPAEGYGFVLTDTGCWYMGTNEMYDVTFAFRAGEPAITASTPLPEPITIFNEKSWDLQTISADTYRSADYTFMGWTDLGTNYVAKEIVPGMVTNNVTLYAQFALVAKASDGEPIEVSTNGTGKVAIIVTEEWVDANVTPLDPEKGAEAWEINAVLEQPDANGLKKWQNYVLGLENETNKVGEVTATVASEAAQVDDVNKIPVIPEVNPKANTGFRVTYELTNIVDHVLVAAGAIDDLQIDLTQVTTNAKFKVNVVITPDDAENGEKISSTNTIGVLKTAAKSVQSLISVPWESFGASNEVTVAGVVKTANLTPGDKMHVYDETIDNYYVWELVTNKTWKPVSQKIGKKTVSGGPADEYFVTRGTAVWIDRADTTTPVCFYGQAAEVESATTAIVEAESATEPSWNLVASPAVTDLDLNAGGAIKTKATDGDEIQIPTDTTPMNYKFVNGQWCYPTFVEYKIGKIVVKKTVWTPLTSDMKIPAGQGFWYLNKGGEKEIAW